MKIKYGDYLPDLADNNNPGATVAKNCIPDSSDYGYKDVNSLSTYSDALTARAQGAISVRDIAGNSYNFAGDATKLYELTASVWTDRSAVGGYTCNSDEFWNFDKFGETLIATTITENPQAMTLGGSVFADLAGTPPKARYIAVVREYVFLANVNDSVDGVVPERVWWSGFDDATSWTAGTNGCDYQSIPGGGGWIQGVVGGEYGTVFQERAIHRFTLTSGGFQRDEVETGKGTPSPRSIVKWGALIPYLGQDGFYIFDGVSSTPIGQRKVDKTFFADVDNSYLYRVNGQIDWVNKLILWAYPGPGNTGGRPNKILVYNWTNGRWSTIEVDTDLLFNTYSEGYHSDNADALGDPDLLDISMDSRIWTGNNTVMGAFNSTFELAYFTGTALTAVLETSEFQANEGARTRLRSLRPIGEGGTHSIQVGSRNSTGDSVSWGAAIPQAPSGRYATRSNARYHRLRNTISGGFDHATMIEIEGVKGGKR